MEPKFQLEVCENNVIFSPSKFTDPILRNAGLDSVENRPFLNLFRSESRALHRRNIPLHMRSKVQTVVVHRSFKAYIFCWFGLG